MQDYTIRIFKEINKMSLVLLQRAMGVTADGVFGPKTADAAMKWFKLTPIRAAHFFGQCSHESAGFKIFEENLNYSASGLRKTFSKYFPNDAIASQYARKPRLIASRVYANRMGNGPESSEDGWKYRGRGAIQLTGKSNYAEFQEYIKDPSILNLPDQVASKYSFNSAIFYFNKNNLWKICDKGIDDATITTLTKRINGGYNGLAERKELTKKYASWLGI